MEKTPKTNDSLRITRSTVRTSVRAGDTSGTIRGSRVMSASYDTVCTLCQY
ncbi:MAG TPA: hypothetical protein PKY30_13485 [Myxococcota bacterium]|nr:hypothetical protein [Myxococcota bacterium]HNH48051.1 hypothetical protein [Myxococcota bacterium]